MSYQPKDRFFKKAKADAYVARSVYKLDELDRRYRLFSKGQHIVDLGCAPGSWLQFLADRTGKKGRVVGYDIVPCELSLGPRVHAAVADVYKLSAEQIWADLRGLDPKPSASAAKLPVRVDALISDMAPKLCGIRDADQARSVALVDEALRLAAAVVRPEGFFVAKLFQGRDTDELVSRVKAHFKTVKLLKPEATREGSREVFLLARGRRPLSKS